MSLSASQPPPPDPHRVTYESIRRAFRQRKRRRLFWRCLIGLFVYAVIWDVTAYCAAGWIARSLHERFDLPASPHERPVSISVYTSCPAPFIVLADWTINHDPYPHGGETAWYFVTPLHVYEIARVGGAWRH